MPSTTVNRGNVLYTVVVQQTLTPSAVAGNTTAEQAFTVPGVQMGDQLSALEFQGAYTSNVTIANVRVSALNTMSVAFQNNTSGSLTPPAGTYYIEVNRLEGSVGATNAA